MKKTATATSTLFAIVLIMCGNPQAQEEMKTNFVTQATSRLVIPAGDEEKSYWKMQQEYYENVISKSKLVVHYSICRHAWGSEGATIVERMEFANWNDIEKFTKEESRSLAAAAWPDEKAREAFFKKWRSYEDPYHHDEIYSISLSMRK